MKSLLLLPITIAISIAALAEPICNAPKEKWMKQADFKHAIETQGYKVKTLKVTNVWDRFVCVFHWSLVSCVAFR